MSSVNIVNTHEVAVHSLEADYRHRHNSELICRKDTVLHWYIAVDFLALIIGFLFSTSLAAYINTIVFDREFINPITQYGYLRLIEIAALAAVIILWFQHTDHYRIRMPFWMEIKKIVSVLLTAMLLDGFLQFSFKLDSSRLWLVAGWCVAAGAMIISRNLIRRHFREAGAFHIKAVLVGGGDTAGHTRMALNSEPGLGYEIVAQVRDLPSAFMQAGKSWSKFCENHGADYIIIALDGQELASAHIPLSQLARESVPFSVCPPLGGLPVFGMTTQYFFNHDIMLLTRSNGLEQPIPCILKRLTDIAASLSALIIFSPVMLVVAALVKRDGGPALFGHSRIGRSGKEFRCLKFRSMVMNGDAVLQKHLEDNAEARLEWQASRKLHNDPRVTRLGAFLRKSSLDELPQLINVLRGEMSLVGPRPIVSAEINNYAGDIAHYYKVRPGVTGLWQVSGRSDVSYPQRVHMDSWYVRNWSFWHDIAIICKTFPALLKSSGAY